MQSSYPKRGFVVCFPFFPETRPSPGRIDFNWRSCAVPCFVLLSAARWMGSSSSLSADDSHYCRCKEQSVDICAGNGFPVPLHTRWRPDRKARAGSEQIQNKCLNLYLELLEALVTLPHLLPKNAIKATSAGQGNRVGRIVFLKETTPTYHQYPLKRRYSFILLGSSARNIKLGWFEYKFVVLE